MAAAFALQPAEVAEGNSGRSVMGEPPGMLVARALPSGPNPFRAVLPYLFQSLQAHRQSQPQPLITAMVPLPDTPLPAMLNSFLSPCLPSAADLVFASSASVENPQRPIMGAADKVVLQDDFPE